MYLHCKCPIRSAKASFAEFEQYALIFSTGGFNAVPDN